METYIQTAIGISVSLILFFVGYRQTIGARKERAKNANLAVLRAIMRRMVLENYAPQYSDISKILEGKAREFQIPTNDLLSEDQVLNSLYTDVFDNDLISPNQRKEIEMRLNEIFDEQQKQSSKPTIAEISQLKAEKEQNKQTIWTMVLAASLLGATSSVVYRFISDPSPIELELLTPILGIVISSIAILSGISAIRRSKEAEFHISKGSAHINSAFFELDIAKAIERVGISYQTEPKVGGWRPDFLIQLSGKRIAVEAKAWDETVPLSQLQAAIDYMRRLLETDQIDSAILVTKKLPPVKGFDSANGRIQILSLSDFSSFLRKKAA